MRCSYVPPNVVRHLKCAQALIVVIAFLLIAYFTSPLGRNVGAVDRSSPLRKNKERLSQSKNLINARRTLDEHSPPCPSNNADDSAGGGEVVLNTSSPSPYFDQLHEPALVLDEQNDFDAADKKSKHHHPKCALSTLVSRSTKLPRKENCTSPLIAWDSPLEGGPRAGISSEAVSYLVPLSRRLPVHLVNVFRDESSYLASLSPADREQLVKLKRYSLLRAVKEQVPDIYISQWDPEYAVKQVGKYQHREQVYRVGRVMYEATKLPHGWISSMDSSFDEIWAPTKWGRDLIISNGFDPSRVHVVIEGLDTVNTFNPSAFNRERARKQVYPEDVQNTFIFLSVFKWEERKAYKELIRAFAQEFNCTENITLILRTTPDSKNITKIVFDLTKKVVECIRILPPQPDLLYPAMYHGADAFVLASHGEGWGRPLFEAMAMGLPVIGTNWSGPTEFITPETGLLLPVDDLIVAEGLPGAGSHDQKWAKIDVPKLQSLMRNITSNRAEAIMMGQRARAHIQRHYDQEVVSLSVLERLRAICHEGMGVRRKLSSSSAGGGVASTKREQPGNWIYEEGNH